MTETLLRVLDIASKDESLRKDVRLVCKAAFLKLSSLNSWDDIQSEITRKTLSVIDCYYSKFEKKEISKETLIHVLNAVFDSISGVANSKNCTDLIIQLIKEVKEGE